MRKCFGSNVHICAHILFYYINCLTINFAQIFEIMLKYDYVDLNKSARALVLLSVYMTKEFRGNILNRKVLKLIDTKKICD